MARNRSANPFYALLLIAGVCFSLTACAYGVMTVSELHAPSLDGRTDTVHPLNAFLDQHGFRLMMTEIGIIGLCTIAAIGTDDYWDRRQLSAKPLEKGKAQ